MRQALCVLALSSFFFGACTSHGAAPLEPVADLDLDAYLGEWHQVAAIPAWFQKKCVANTRATYARAEDKISVLNSCEQADGTRREAHGLARLNPLEQQNSKLQVTFLNTCCGWLWFFAGDYWVLELGEGYSYSIVGDPKRKYLWVLSRQEQMSAEELVRIEASVRAFGYESSRVLVTQSGPLMGQPLSAITTP